MACLGGERAGSGGGVAGRVGERESGQGWREGWRAGLESGRFEVLGQGFPHLSSPEEQCCIASHHRHMALQLLQLLQFFWSETRPQSGERGRGWGNNLTHTTHKPCREMSLCGTRQFEVYRQSRNESLSLMNP